MEVQVRTLFSPQHKRMCTTYAHTCTHLHTHDSSNNIITNKGNACTLHTHTHANRVPLPTPLSYTLLLTPSTLTYTNTHTPWIHKYTDTRLTNPRTHVFCSGPLPLYSPQLLRALVAKRRLKEACSMLRSLLHWLQLFSHERKSMLHAGLPVSCVSG